MLRFIIAPTEDMHIGYLRRAILNFLVAQQKNRGLHIIVKDIGIEKNLNGKDTEIIEILEKFALSYTSVFHLSEHLHLYQTLALRLLEEKKAFVCTCVSDEAPRCLAHCQDRDKNAYRELKDSNQPFVLRVKRPHNDISFHDLLYGNIIANPDEIGEFVILDTHGSPTANFAVACEDMLLGVSMVIEDETHLKATSKQLYIQKLLGFKHTTLYLHLPLLHNTYTIRWLFEQGYIPDAILNALLLLDQSLTPKEIFTLPEAMTWFKLERVTKASSKFDIDRLRFINREHLIRMDDKQLSTLFGFADADIGKLAKIYLQEAYTINELAVKIRPIFAPKSLEGLDKKEKEEIRSIQEIIFDAPMIEEFNAFKNYIMLKSDLSEERVTEALGILLTGVKKAPFLSDIYPFIKPYLLEVVS